MARVTLENIWKLYGKTPAVKNVNLVVEDGELVVLVGASGCGKTSTLRMVAGLETVSKGRITINGSDVTRVSPGKRNASMVFQSYALYPHMTVKKNLTFGPRIRHENKVDVDRRVDEVVGLLGLGTLLERHPGQLSGGQRQRVALGRALLREPAVFLFDEPLSNLDAALRTELRQELSELHNRIRSTMIYVTHDQVEAMTMADRLGVMDDGVLLQIGTPEEVYESPASLKVAQFLGSPKINTLPAFLGSGETGRWLVLLESGATLEVLEEDIKRAHGLIGKAIICGIRPEDWVRVVPGGEQGIVGVVKVVEPLGSETILTVVVPGTAEVIRWRVGGRNRLHAGESICLTCDPARLYIFDAETGRAVVTPGGRNIDNGPRVINSADTEGTPMEGEINVQG